MNEKIPRNLALIYAGTILLSAFLLFQVQPVISKWILPWFGGSPGVWTTSMLFFQMLLLAGYLYAHVSEHAMNHLTRAAVHLGLLVLALVVLPIAPSVSWKPTDAGNPTWRILALLTVSVGLPYFVLSTTGPLLQAWFGRAFPGRSPYRLYALSNVGSLAALLSYPFLVEPAWDLTTQASWWSGGFVVFAVLCAVVMAQHWRADACPDPADGAEKPSGDAGGPSPSFTRRLLWLGLPALASLMLLATTNHVCQDMAVIPFLWIVPLSLYLISFIICFDHPRWYVRRVFAGITLPIVFAVSTLGELSVWLQERFGEGVSHRVRHTLNYTPNFEEQILLHFAALFCICMVCHGELARLKPHRQHLTSFYVLIAAGGALGGALVSLVAPAIFVTFAEWKIGLAISFAVAAAALLWAHPAIWTKTRIRTGLAWSAVACGMLGAMLYLNSRTGPGRGERLLAEARNFYGRVSVVERAIDDPDERDFVLFNGRIIHGVQFASPERRHLPITYYSAQSGLGRTLGFYRGRVALRVATIGLGTGTVAAYALPGQVFRFYEINPEVVRLANTYFSYLKDCQGIAEIVLGDARLSLEREPPQHFHVLVLDAFSGDAIPTHLLTRQALEIYRRHLTHDGVIAVHVTNKYLDLAPVVQGLADDSGMQALLVSTPADEPQQIKSADWILLSHNTELIAAIRQDNGYVEPMPDWRLLWTDEYTNLFKILK